MIMGNKEIKNGDDLESGSRVGYIFDIGDTCYPKGCTREYQRNNIIKINHRKTRTESYLDSETGDIYKTSYYLYSENGFGWYPENTLEKI